MAKNVKVYVNGKSQQYEIAEYFLMKYENFIYLCNNISELFSSIKKVGGGNSVVRAAMFYCNRADKILLLSFSDSKMAVLYNAGQKVDVRQNSHRARNLQAAEKRKLKEILANMA